MDAVAKTALNLRWPVAASCFYGSEDQFLWVGMQDYVPHIVLATALSEYEASNAEVLRGASDVLKRGLSMSVIKRALTSL